MEIPGLHRLQSPSEQGGDEGAQPVLPPPTSNVPKIDPALESRIAAMRAQIKERQQSQVATTVEDQAVSVPRNSTEPAASTHTSIIDSVLARHGLQVMEESDEEDVTMANGGANVESDSDTSSYVSSEEESSSDSDDEDTAQGPPLTAEERERILIEADNDGPVSNELPRTKNEIAEDEEPIQTPDFEILSTDAIEHLGIITSIVGRSCVVTGSPTPETKVLDVGSLLVFENRKNLGYIADTFGPVILPMFSVRFSTVEDLQAAGVELGKPVYVALKYASYVFSDTLRVKGTDASNIHDEEQSETEFSDDEQEARYKLQKKHQRRSEKQQSKPIESRKLNDLESIAMAQGLPFEASQNQARLNPSSASYATAQQDQYSGTYGARMAQRSEVSSRPSFSHGRDARGRGRPETNNFGLGPRQSAQANHANFEATSSAMQYQRSFYQQDQSHEASDKPAPAPATTITAQSSTLYSPLRRPG